MIQVILDTLKWKGNKIKETRPFHLEILLQRHQQHRTKKRRDSFIIMLTKYVLIQKETTCAKQVTRADDLIDENVKTFFFVRMFHNSKDPSEYLKCSNVGQARTHSKGNENVPDDYLVQIGVRVQQTAYGFVMHRAERKTCAREPFLAFRLN